MVRMSAVERRAALIQAALRVIARDGVAAATTRAVCAEAGSPLASFHYAFRSRDELIAELIAFVVEHEIAAARTALTPGADLVTVIREGLYGYLDLLAADPLREQAMFELTQYAMRTPELAASARLQYDSYRRTAVTLLTVAAEHTACTWDRPVEEVARILVALTDGLTLGWLVDRDTPATRRVVDFAASAIAALASTSPTPPGAAGDTGPTGDTG